MKIKEYDESRAFKVPGDVERYLLRIIQRYFDVESTYSAESTEAIIIESLTRLKRDFMSKKGFVFNLNQLTGHITLNISIFNGEPVFDKKTAFNKDFGSIVDTIVEGNDPRLSDERDPLYHVHTIGHIKELEDLLNQSKLPQAAHSHRNQNILDMLTYAGTQTQIDLILVELFTDKIAKRMETLTSIRHGLIFGHDTDMKPLYDQLTYVQKHLIAIQKLSIQVLAWVDAAKQYTKISVQAVADYLEDLIRRCMTPEEAQVIYDKFKRFVYLAEEGEIPLPDGQISLHAETSEDISAGDGDAGTLRIIFEEGLQLGNTNWSWDNNTMSFVYNTNDSSYSVFLSPNTYQDYTHRVTLKSNNSDDDVISVILAYDDETQSHLSLICHVGGLVNGATNSSTPCISVVKDFYKNGSFTIQPVENLFHNFGVNKTGWNALTNGISILVKRTNNIFKVWTLYNELHDWHVVRVGNRMEITPTQKPTFEFDLTKYPTLSPFVDKACKYGYGCMSQARSTYSDVFYYAPLDIGGVGDKQGHTTITRYSNLTYMAPDDTLNESTPINSGRVKLFFRYDKIIPQGKEPVYDDLGQHQPLEQSNTIETHEEEPVEDIVETVTIPLPLLAFADHQTVISIQGATFAKGGFDVDAKIIHTIPDYITDENIYNNQEAIIMSTAKNRLTEVLSMFSSLERPYALCLLKDAQKFNFVKALLQNEHEYFFQALYEPRIQDGDATWNDSNHNPLTFFNWANGQPNIIDDESIMGAYLKYTNSGWKMHSEFMYGGDAHGYVAEYPIKYLSDYFTNPRIYYQIYGIKE